MKRLSLLFVLLIFILAGCGNDKEVSNISSAAKTAGYIFEIKGISIPMNAEAGPIIEKLGKPKDYFEADSCAFQGKEKTYTYSGFELHTYENNKTDYVSSISFLDDSVSTKEGISIASKLSDVKKKYGDKFKEDMGLLTYEMDKSKLSFVVEKDEITSVEYTAITK